MIEDSLVVLSSIKSNQVLKYLYFICILNMFYDSCITADALLVHTHLDWTKKYEAYDWQKSML